MIGLKKAVLATILVLVAPSFEYWNFTLYSESLFFSLILFFLGACIRHKPTTIRNIGLQLLILMGCVISRPMGILLVIPWIFYVSASNSKKFSWKIIISSFAIGLLPLIIISNSILGTIGDWNVLDPFYKGYIICGIPSNTSLNQFPTQAKTPIGQLIELLINNPNLLISLSIKKIIAFFFQCRSYYSLPHNFYIIIYTATTMSLFFYSLFKHGTKQPILKMSLMIIFFWTISIILQCDDYHSRFYSAIIPLISIVCVGIKGNLMK
jgi:hypothetical protein